MLLKSGQPEILRAAQRDDKFTENLKNSFTEILQSILGIRTWFRHKETLAAVPDVIYYGCTTLSGLQTLGEEYTGIIQVSSSGKSLQRKYVQFLMLFINIYGEKFTIDLLKHFEKHIRGLPINHPLTNKARQTLILTSEKIRNAVPFIKRIHRAIFYLNGNYYDFGKRLTCTRYAIMRHWLKDRSTLPAFRLLGLISFVHLGVHLLKYGMNLKSKYSNSRSDSASDSSDYVSNKDKCSLCLNKRESTTSTSCGHLFCWDCIVPWLLEQPKCPLCRTSVMPSRVVLLQNY